MKQISTKNKHYDIRPILDKGCQYNLIVGERLNGKSFAVKRTILQDAIQGKLFCYVRRWKDEIKAYAVENYFEDFVYDYDDSGNEVRRIYGMTGGLYTDILAVTGKIYFATLDDYGKKVKGQLIGYYFSLASQTSYKSQSYPQAYNLVFEEFITIGGYLPNEPKNLMHLISTIFRQRTGKIFLIGNTINRTFPYLQDWGLYHVLHQKRKTIEVYEIKNDEDNNTIRIAVEITENDLKNNRLAFGKNVTSITNGEWETEQFLHLDNPLTSYHIYYQMYAIYGYMQFRISLLIEEKNPFLYIEEWKYEIPPNSRVVTNNYNCDIMYTRTFMEHVTIYDKTISYLLNRGKFRVENDLVGTDFCAAFKIK